MESNNERASRIMRELFKRLDYNNITKFAQEIGTNYMQVYYTYNGKTGALSQELIDKIVARFPNVNRAYLDSGVGKVLVDDPDDLYDEFSIVSGGDIYTLLDKVTVLMTKIEAREARLDEKEKQLMQREERIDNLLKQLVYHLCNNGNNMG